MLRQIVKIYVSLARLQVLPAAETVVDYELWNIEAPFECPTHECCIVTQNQLLKSEDPTARTNSVKICSTSNCSLNPIGW